MCQIFPIVKKQSKSKKRLLDQVSVPAANLAVKIQLSASTYDFGPQLPANPFKAKPIPFNKRDVEEHTLIDIETRKTLRADSNAVSARSDPLGNILMPLEPSLKRTSGNKEAVELREMVYLVELHQASKKRKRGDL